MVFLTCGSICSNGCQLVVLEQGGVFFFPSLDYYKYGPTLKPLTAGGLLGDNLVAPKRGFLASSYDLVSLT